MSAGPDAITIDVSCGDGEPLLPTAERGSRARVLLERHLPALVLDARRAVEIGSRVERLADEASIDSLTRLPNRRMLGRALGRVRAGDVVIMLDLDHFKKINDIVGHDAGDALLRAAGATLLAAVRERDSVGRYGGDEFVVILRGDSDADAFLTRLRAMWETDRPHPVTLSAGVAVVEHDALVALRAADHAMHRAKEDGGDRVMWADEADDREGVGTADAANAAETAGQIGARTAPIVGPTTQPGRAVTPVGNSQAFVAFSQISVAEDGRGSLEEAFAHRLGAVDHWPGFRSLEVWADVADPTSYVMVSWWDSAADFRRYMQSDEHRLSHDRIPTGADRPVPRGFRRFTVIHT
jgi:diguanylate cyclase (GGDEF)-like protein